jgi:type VI protein secretion system component VasF
MAAARSKKTPSKQRAKTNLNFSSCRALVLVDSQPLRTKVWKQYQAALKKFEKYTADLQQFKKTDSERYRLWYESEFAREITQIHKSRAAIAELSDWMEQIEAFAEYHDIPLATALRELKDAKAEGRLDALWEDLVKEIEDSEKEKDQAETDKEQEWQKFESAFDDIFDEATEDYFEGHTEGHHSGKRKGAVRDEAMEQSLRKLYHQLALKLHPDTNPDQTQEQKQLFLQMQEAYRDQDIESLERIWKKLDGTHEEPFSSKTAAISEILHRKNSLNKKSRDLGTELKYAKAHPAWNFSKTLKNKAELSYLKQKIKHALKHEQADMDAIWLELNEQIQQVERQAQRSGKRKAKVKSKFP